MLSSVGGQSVASQTESSFPTLQSPDATVLAPFEPGNSSRQTESRYWLGLLETSTLALDWALDSL